MSEIINETINELNKPTQNNVFSIEDNPVTVLEKINQVERYLKQIDTSVDTSINTANEALEKANNAFEANGTLVKINGENQLTWSADFAESERQKSKNLLNKDLLKIGCYIFATGQYSYDVNYMASEPISVTPNSTITVSCNGFEFNSGCGFVFFNNGVYVGYLSNGATVATVPANANQVIYNFYKVDITKDDLQYAQLEYGSTATDYQPYNGAIVHKKDIEPVLIYDRDTKNTIGGTAYTSGIKSGTIINHNFSQYKKLILTVYRDNVGAFDYEINLEYLDTSELYGGSGITYSFQAQDNYFVFSSARISADKQTMVYIKSGYTETFFETIVSTNDVPILRIRGIK